MISDLRGVSHEQTPLEDERSDLKGLPIHDSCPLTVICQPAFLG